MKLVFAQSSPFIQVSSIQGPSDGIASIIVSPDGKKLAYGNFSDNLIRIVDISTQQEILTLSGHTNVVTEIAFSPNGQYLASTGTVNLGPDDGTVRIWDAASGTQLAVVETAPGGTSQLAFSPDGNMLAGASGGDPLFLHIWDIPTLNVIHSISGVFRLAAFNQDGSRIATGKRDNFLYLIDVSTGNELVNFSGHDGWVQSVAYSHNGELIATGSDDNSIKVRDASSGDASKTLTGHSTYPEYLMFNPDASMLASLGSGVNITRTSGGGIGITFNPSFKFIRIWDLDSGTELPRVNIESDALSAVSLSTNWNVLATGSDEGLIRIFELSGSTEVIADEIPSNLELFQNYPNPFNPITTIKYSLEAPQFISIKVYDMLGNVITELVNQEKQAGIHSIQFNGSNLSSGTYYYKLQTEKISKTKKLLLLK